MDVLEPKGPAAPHFSGNDAAPPCPTNDGAPSGLFAHSGLGQAMGMYLSATVAVRLINFARVLLLTWWMLPQQFGLLNMILLAINVLTPLCSLGLNEAVARYVPQHETRGTLRQFARRSFVMLLLITGASVLLMSVFARYLGDFFYAQVYTNSSLREEFGHDAPDLARVSAGVTGLVIIYFYLLAIFKGLRMFKAVAAMETMHAVAFLIACAVAAAANRRAAITMTTLYGLSLTLPIAYFGLAFSRRLLGWKAQSQTPRDDPWVARLLQFSVWTTLAGITWQVLLYYPSWYLNKMHGHEAVAIFSAPRQIGQFIMIGAVAIVTVVSTAITKTWESQGRQRARLQLSLAFRGFGLALLVACTVFSLGRHWIMRMFRVEYMPGAEVLPLHLMFFLMGSYLAFLSIHFQLIEKTRHLFWPWATGVAANVLCAFWLAGPGRSLIQNTRSWSWLSSHGSGFFVAGISDPLGLGGAAWCGVFAMSTALLLCVLLIRAECARLDRGTCIVIASALLLALRPELLAAGVGLLLISVFTTSLVFSPAERKEVVERGLNYAGARAPGRKGRS